MPDAGGPLGNVADALDAWAATHPEIDRLELRPVIDRPLREHR